MPTEDFKGLAPAPGLTGLASLTSREQEILGLIARRHSNAEMAEAFVISEGTVKTFVKRVLPKLEVRDWTQVTVLAYELGLVRTGEGDEGSIDPVRLGLYRTGLG